MFILYTGWGYWSYELDWEQMELEQPSINREPDQYIQSRLFELPDFAKKEINLQGYAVTEYLLPTHDSEEDMDIRFPYINTPRFYVCSDNANYVNYGYPEERDVIKIIIAAKDFINIFPDRKMFLFIESIENGLSNPAKNRKKLIPLQRESNSALPLLYEFFNQYDIKYSDECSSDKAWEIIMTGEFSSEYIKEKLTNKLILDDGKKISKSDFSEKYRKRFKIN